MASTSFSFSNQLVGGKFSAAHALNHLPCRCFASHATLQTTSLYEVLGIQTGATCQEIKSAYRKLARVLHPDVASSSNDREVDTSAADEFMRVHEAYTILSDPEKRAVYNGSIFRLRRRAVAPSTLTRRRRTWETDQCW